MHAINFRKLGMVALFSVVLAGCGTTTTEVEEPDQDANNISQPSAPASATPAQPSAEELERRRLEQEEQEMLAVTTFYFDFDRAELKPEAREALVYHANQLRANPNMSVRLEGHADERGTREYNLALGERRAQAVERYLQVQGVSADQMEIISYGEERPAVNGTTEAAYARNRRVELIY